MIEDQKIKQHHKVKRGLGVKDGNNPGKRGGPQKRGGPGGSQKSPNFAHGGGKSGGGFFGGVPEQGLIKHEVL